MANQEHLDILKEGVDTWNEWRTRHPEVKPDLSVANLSRANLSKANLSKADLTGATLGKVILTGADLTGATLFRATLTGANLTGATLFRATLTGANLTGATLTGATLSFANFSKANFSKANLTGANFSGATLSFATLTEATLFRATLTGANLNGAILYEAILMGATLNFADLTGATLYEATLNFADLTGATLYEANLFGADLTGADLTGTTLSRADLTGTNFSKAILTGADLTGATLSRATLVETNLTRAILTQCTIYGISVWNVQLDGAKQENLVITDFGEPTITVDNLEVAQFIHLLLNNAKIREVIDTIAKKAVLILGRFTPERKAVLDALREKLRTLNFLPIVFDFERSAERDFTETIMTLAGLSCFIIADITNPKSTPLELQATVPNYMIPFVPIIQEGEQPFSMFQDLEGKFDWVLDILVYDTPSNLIKGLERAVVKPALKMRDELLSKKVEQLRTRHIGDYL